MQDVERVARAIARADARDGREEVLLDGESYRSLARKLATATISAMTPDTAPSHALPLHKFEAINYIKDEHDLEAYAEEQREQGWNDAIEAAAEAMEQRVGDEWLRAAQVIRQLKKPSP